MSTEAAIREAIRTQVIDPEVRINLVDLGLIYGVRLEQKQVTVTMTLTSLGCPEGPKLMAEVKQAAESASGLPAKIELVWEPAWNMSMMSPDAKDELGI